MRMRVIAGTARGRKLATVSPGTRPTPDRVREALFSILAVDTPGARVLDLYSGTGALGIEALSRGAAHATFVEKDRGALATLRTNLQVVPHSETRVLGLPVKLALTQLAAAEEPCFDMVFVDPPYALELVDQTARQLARVSLVCDGGLIICEHGSNQQQPRPPAGFENAMTRSWGDVSMTLLRKDSGAAP